MGLGIYATAKIGSKDKTLAVIGAIAEAVEEAAGEVDEVMARSLSVHQAGDGVTVRLFPGAEWVEFKVESGRVEVMTKTSTLGPGYHAAVVDVIDAVGDACELRWDWSEDETSYGKDRDFDALCEEMRSLLTNLASTVRGMRTSKGYTGPIFVNWGIETGRRDGPWAVVTASGTFSEEWLERAADGATDEVCSQFYTWWERDRDEAEWAKLAAMLIWSEVRWHPPGDEDEALWMEMALDAADRAGAVEMRRRGVSEADLEELAAYLEGDPEEWDPPRPAGFGFFRGVVQRWVGSGWTVKLPGWFYQEVDEEDGTVVLWTPGRVVRVSIADVERGEGEEELAGPAFEYVEKHAEGRTVDFSREGISALAAHTAQDEDGRSLLGAVVVEDPSKGRGELAMVTITYTDDADAAWAESVFATVERPPLRDE